MAGLLSGEKVEAISSSETDLNVLLKFGTPGGPVIEAQATRSDHHLSALVWNYHDDGNVDAPASDVDFKVAGLPFGVNRVLVEHFRIDGEHSNAFQFWKSIGSPQSPTKEQYAALEAAGQLQLITSPEWINVPKAGNLLHFRLAFPGKDYRS